MSKITNISNFFRNCPKCEGVIFYKSKYLLKRAEKNHTICKICYYNRPKNTGPFIRNCPECNKKLEYSKLDTYNTSEKRKVLCNSCGQKKRKYSLEWGEKMKEVLHRSDVREKHLRGIRNSTWAKVKTDKGQIELLEKWNKLGFNLEPNYKIHSETEFFYIDGYDKEKNIVIEYDSRYHFRPYIQQKDIIRQQKIIKILKPRKFWRYNSVNKTWSEVGGMNV